MFLIFNNEKIQSKHIEYYYIKNLVLQVDAVGVKVKSMAYTSVGKNSFKWPSKDDIIYYDPDQILCSIQPPIPINNRFFGLSDEDFFGAAKEMSIRDI